MPDKMGSMDTPELANSEHFTTKRAKIAFNIKAGKVESYYELVLGIVKPFPDGAFLEVQFENPVDAASPLIAAKEVKPADLQITVYSPPFYGRETDQNYQVVVEIYSDRSKKILLGKHVQLIRSFMDD